MSYRVKSSLYFASFIIAAIAYYNVGQADAQDIVMAKEIYTIQNKTIAAPNGVGLINIQ